MNYRSFSDLNNDITKNLHRVPADVDVVVGIPRSGMLVASLVALALNLPLADIDGFALGRVLSSGTTRRRHALDRPFEDMRHALVLDDSVHSGGSMTLARSKLTDLPSSIRITYGAIYGVRDTVSAADIIFEIVPQPRVFQWNFMHHNVLGEACVDIDGVLCLDPTTNQNDDGAAYLDFLRTAQPLFLPTKKIATLVTSRLEKYRAETEFWLRENHVDYDRLIMLDLPDASTRQRLGAHGSFKGNFYRRDSATLFIESEVGQAIEIARISGKDVLCLADHRVYRPGNLSPLRGVQRLRQSNKVRKLARIVLGNRTLSRLKAVF